MKLYLFIFIAIFPLSSLFASDSLRTETINGKQVTVYRVEQGQTLYSIARKFGTSVNEIKALNPNLAQLKTGSEIYLPSKIQSSQETNTVPAKTPGTDSAPKPITHIVSQGETIYKISRQYNVSVADLSKYNSLSNGLKIGQELIIPQKELSTNPVATTPTTPAPTKVEKKTSATGYPSISETGTARLDENIDSELAYLALHKTASIGTLLLIKNKENGNTVHAKVTGSTKNGETSLLVVNKKVMEKLESKTNTFTVEIFYTPEQ